MVRKASALATLVAIRSTQSIEPEQDRASWQRQRHGLLLFRPGHRRSGRRRLHGGTPELMLPLFWSLIVVVALTLAVITIRKTEVMCRALEAGLPDVRGSILTDFRALSDSY